MKKKKSNVQIIQNFQNKCELLPPGLYTFLASETVSIYLERKRRKRKVMFKLLKKEKKCGLQSIIAFLFCHVLLYPGDLLPTSGVPWFGLRLVWQLSPHQLPAGPGNNIINKTSRLLVAFRQTV